MRRWLFITALGAALLAIPVLAQRGGRGGMSMGGGRGGFSSGGGSFAPHGSGFGHGSSYGGTPQAGAYWGGGSRGWNGGAWNGSGWNSWGWRGSYPYRYPYRPWGYRSWAYGYGGWGWPWWGWYGGLGWYDSSYAYGSYPATYAVQTYPSYVYVSPDNSNYYEQNSQAQQQEIDRLNNEMAALRAQRESQKSAQQPQPKAQIHAETVLIYRDGHAEGVVNYAIVGNTIWVFNETRARKISLSDLDLPATKRDNEDRGIDFVLPASSH